VVKGKGAMPPKGGAASDADAKAAVDYMFSKAK
jgi:cytochrome c5